MKCTQCEKVYKQVVNFVEHFKKEHICKKSNCTSKAACKRCREKIVTAKEQWHQVRKNDLMAKTEGEQDLLEEVAAAKTPATKRRRKIMQVEDILTIENKTLRQDNSKAGIEHLSKEVTTTGETPTKNYRGKKQSSTKVFFNNIRLLRKRVIKLSDAGNSQRNKRVGNVNHHTVSSTVPSVKPQSTQNDIQSELKTQFFSYLRLSSNTSTQN